MARSVPKHLAIGAFLAAVGRNLDALYRQKQQAHAAKYGL